MEKGFSFRFRSNYPPYFITLPVTFVTKPDHTDYSSQTKSPKKVDYDDIIKEKSQPYSILWISIIVSLA